MFSSKRLLENSSELEHQTIFEHKFRQDIKVESIEAKNIKKEPLEFPNDLTENQHKIEAADDFIFEHDHRREIKEEFIETKYTKNEPAFEVSDDLTENQRKVEDSFTFEHDLMRQIKEERIETKDIKKELAFETSNDLTKKHYSKRENLTIFEHDLPKRIKLEVCTLNGIEEQVFEIKKPKSDAASKLADTEMPNQKYKEKFRTDVIF